MSCQGCGKGCTKEQSSSATEYLLIPLPSGVVVGDEDEVAVTFNDGATWVVLAPDDQGDYFVLVQGTGSDAPGDVLLAPGFYQGLVRVTVGAEVIIRPLPCPLRIVDDPVEGTSP